MSSSRFRAVIAVDLDYFYAQCEEVRDPSIREKPVVVCVYSRRTEISGAVSTCNYVARGLGVRSGIPIVQAMRILKDRTDSVFLPVDMEYYETVSERIMDILRRNCDRFEQASVDEAFLELLKFDQQYNLVSARAQEIKEEILLSEKLTCSVGVGTNKLLAKMAVDSKKPDGFTTILPGEERHFLDPLPVGKLYGIGPKTEEKLKTINVSRIGELALTDQKVLTDLFGKNLGPTLRRLANGIDASPVQERPVEQFSRIVTLKKDAEYFDFQDVLEEIALDLSNKLRSAKLTSRTIGIIAISSLLKTRSRSRSSSVGIQSIEKIYETASELFSELFQEDLTLLSPLKLRRVGIRVSDLSQEQAIKKGSLERYF